MRGLMSRAMDHIESLRDRWIGESLPALPERMTPLKPPAIETIAVSRFELECCLAAMVDVRAAFGPADRYPPPAPERKALQNLQRACTGIRDVILLDSIRASLDEPKESRR